MSASTPLGEFYATLEERAAYCETHVDSDLAQAVRRLQDVLWYRLAEQTRDEVGARRPEHAGRPKCCCGQAAAGFEGQEGAEVEWTCGLHGPRVLRVIA